MYIMKTYGFWALQVSILLVVLVLSMATYGASENTGDTAVLAATDEPAVLHADSGAPDPLQVHDVVNQERGHSSAVELAISERLSEVASARALDMKQEGYYAHEHPRKGTTFVDSLASAEYTHAFACENLNLTFSSNAHATVYDWMNSPAHKACLLHEGITHAGYASVALTVGVGQPTPYIVVAVYATE